MCGFPGKKLLNLGMTLVSRIPTWLRGFIILGTPRHYCECSATQSGNNQLRVPSWVPGFISVVEEIFSLKCWTFKKNRFRRFGACSSLSSSRSTLCACSVRDYTSCLKVRVSWVTRIYLNDEVSEYSSRVGECERDRFSQDRLFEAVNLWVLVFIPLFRSFALLP